MFSRNIYFKKQLSVIVSVGRENVLSLRMGYSKKIQTGGWGHGSSGGLEEKTWKFQGSIKKEVEIPGVFEKNVMRNFHGS